MTKSFAGLLEYFVVTFALKEAGYSKETLRSYYTAVEQYIQWVCRIRSIPVEDVDVTCFRKDLIRAFLIHLEEDGKVSVSTRNQRRAAIVSFLGYARDVCPLYANAYIEAQSIKVKKAPKPDKSFLTVDEYECILNSIDINKRNGMMHYLLVTVLYDTAARVDEAVRMNLEDFSFGTDNSIVIFGKGSKYRRIYLTSHSVKVIKAYMKLTGRNSGAVFLNKNCQRISDSGIDYVLKKYAAIAAERMLSIKEKTISPHTLRRSKATHMLLNGASLPVIQRFLGHESIQTTEAYLDAGSEAMVQAVAEAEKQLIEKGVVTPNIPDWHDQNVLQRLKQLANR